MQRIVIAVIATIILTVILLNSMGTIEFGLGHLIARFWALIPLWIGYSFLKTDDQRKNKSGLVLAILGGFLLILNISIFFFENQAHVYAIAITGILAFWPILILVFIGKVIGSFFDRGEEVYRSCFGVQTIENADLSGLDSTLLAQFGKLIFKVKPDDIGIRAVRLDVIAFFGVVEIIVPSGVNVVAESKVRLGCFNVLGHKSKKVLGREVVELGDGFSATPQLLLVTSSWLGKVVVKNADF